MLLGGGQKGCVQCEGSQKSVEPEGYLCIQLGVRLYSLLLWPVLKYHKMRRRYNDRGQGAEPFGNFFDCNLYN